MSRILTLLPKRGRTFFVNATSGSDSASGRSPAAAWQTVAKVNATSLRPGDTIAFERGETWTAGTILQIQSGVTYTTYGGGARPILSPTGVANPILATGKSNVRLIELDCRGGTTGSYFDGCTNVVVVNCSMSGAGNDNLCFINGCNNIAVSGSAFDSAASGGGHAGVEVTDGCTNVLIENCTFNGNPIGITIHNHAATTMPTGITVRNCTISNSSLNAFQISYDGTATQTTQIAVSNVTVDTVSGGHAFAVQRISTGVLSGSVALTNCVAHGTVNGAFYNYHINGVDDVTLMRCLSYHTGAATAERCMRIVDAKRTKVYHATLYRAANPGGIAMIWIDGARGDAVEVKNCIIASGASGLIPIEVSTTFVGGGGSLAIDYNLYQSGTASSVWKYNGTASNFAAWKSASGQDAHSVAGSDPLFTNTAGNDFTLQSGSPAINQGVVISGVNSDYLGAAPDFGYAEKA